MKITVHFEDKEINWLKKFISALDNTIQHPPSQFALQALLQRVDQTGCLELKDITLIISVCQQDNLLPQQQQKLIDVIEKHTGKWGQISQKNRDLAE